MGKVSDRASETTEMKHQAEASSPSAQCNKYPTVIKSKQQQKQRTHSKRASNSFQAIFGGKINRKKAEILN